MKNGDVASDSDTFEDLGEFGIANIVKRISKFIGMMFQYRALFCIFLTIFIAIWLVVYIFGKQTYTATAIIGPPNPSPTNAMLSSMANLGSGGGVRKLLGGMGAGGASSNDQFQEYQQLLKSPRMSVELAKNDDVMRAIFYKKWDSEANGWKTPSLLHNILSGAARVINRPIADYPNDELLGIYLDKHLGVSQVLSSSKSNLMSFGSGYLAISLDFDNPRKAEQLLTTILDKADEIIRQEQYRDIDARISYIKAEMPKILQTEQKDSLIQTLAYQEELKVMMVADKRFSYVLVSMPYASQTPSSPIPPGSALVISIVFSLFLLAILVLLEPRSAFLQRHMSRLRKSRD